MSPPHPLHSSAQAAPAPVAIVGGGAAGTLLALQLAEFGAPTTIFDRQEAFGRGLAYSATSPWHRLNVPIEKMGGWRAEEADQAFQAWYGAQHGPISDFSNRYVPRSSYGQWLHHELDQQVAAGLVELRGEEVVDLVDCGPALRIGTATGGGMSAQLAVLCLGNQKPRPLPVPAGPRHVADIWVPGALDGIANGDPVLIVGTGATGIDALLELHHRGHRGTIYLLSRRGLLPLVDVPPERYLVQHDIVDRSPRLRTIMRQLRRETEAAMRGGYSWQSVIDAFRPHLLRSWRNFSEADRSRFLRHARPHWLVHRHRLAPDIAELVDRLSSEGRLVRLRGRLGGAQIKSDGISVNVVQHAEGTLNLSVRAVIN